MSTVVTIGATHRSAPLALLEQLAIDEQVIDKYLHDLVSRDHVNEAVVISTCNRVEIVVAAEKFHGAYRDVRDFVSDLTYLPPESFADHLEVRHDEEAMRHLFAVAAGLESVVVGEHEILGQVRSAWNSAREAGTSGTVLNLLFRHSLEAGKRARTETTISHHVTSVSHAAVIMADDAVEGLSGRSVAVVGAGSMARGVVDFAASRTSVPVTILNRTVERAAELAAESHRATGLDELSLHVRDADVVFCATSAPGHVLDLDTVAAAMVDRGGRPLTIVDIAMPRDVAAGVGDLDGVTLLDMDALAAFAERGLSRRRDEIPAVEAIVDAEVDRYQAASSAREVAPLVVDLRRRGDELVADELQRHAAKLEALDPAQRELIESMLRATVAKLLHQPTVTLKDAAGSPRGDRLAGSLRELFDL